MLPTVTVANPAVLDEATPPKPSPVPPPSSPQPPPNPPHSFRIINFRLACSLNVLLTLFPLLLYIPTLDSSVSSSTVSPVASYLLFASPIVLAVFLSLVMSLQKRHADGHFTLIESRLTNFFLALLLAVGGAFLSLSVVVVYTHFLSSSSPERNEDLGSDSLYSSLLILYASCVPSISVFLLLMLAFNSPNSPDDDVASLLPDCSCLVRLLYPPTTRLLQPAARWGKGESRVSFYDWHAAYSVWVLVSLMALVFFVLDYALADDEKTMNTIRVTRLVVCAMSSLLDTMFAFSSVHFLKDCFVTIPAIQKIYADKVNTDNRSMRFAWLRRRMMNPSTLVKEKRENGLHYHRAFRDFSGFQEDSMRVDKEVGSAFVVKMALEDAAGKFVKVSSKERDTTRHQMDAWLRCTDGTNTPSSPVVDLANAGPARNLGTLGGARRKNKISAFYSIVPAVTPGSRPAEKDLAGFKLPDNAGVGQGLDYSIELHAHSKPSFLGEREQARVELRGGEQVSLEFPHPDESINAHELDDGNLHAILECSRPCVVVARNFPIEVVDAAATKGQVFGVMDTQKKHDDELKAHRKKLNSLMNIPAPKDVRRGKKTALKYMQDTVDLEFGCMKCDRGRKVVINTRHINKWGKLVVASARMIYPVVAAKIPSVVDKGVKLGLALKECLTGQGGELIDKYRDLCDDLERSEVRADVVVSEAEQKIMRKKLAAAGFYDDYAPAKNGDFVWLCRACLLEEGGGGEGGRGGGE